MEKNGSTYFCEICNYSTNKLTNYNRHLTSNKHKKKLSGPKLYYCIECNKQYKTLWGKKKHEVKCLQKTNGILNIKENSISEQLEFNKQIIDTMKSMTEEIKNLKSTKNIVNVNNNNCNQTNISINLFLNEYCSNAMNLTDFVEKIKYTFEDVMKIYNSGYSKGLSNVVIKELKDIPALDRPIHCTDQKRGTLYIKNNDEWTKNNINTISETEAMICKLRKKQYLALNEWESKNPNWIDSEKLTSMRHELVSKLIGSNNEKELQKQHKEIIKNIANSVPIKDAINKI